MKYQRLMFSLSLQSNVACQPEELRLDRLDIEQLKSVVDFIFREMVSEGDNNEPICLTFCDRFFRLYVNSQLVEVEVDDG